MQQHSSDKKSDILHKQG